MGEGAVRGRAVPVRRAALSVTASPRIGRGETIHARGLLWRVQGGNAAGGADVAE